MRQVLQEFRESLGVGEYGPSIVAGDSAGKDPEEASEHRAAELGQQEQQPDEDDAVDSGQAQPEDWGPPRRRSGMPDAGVVTLEEQPDELHAFGPAAPLETEWRKVRAGLAGGAPSSRVDRAVAAVQR